MTNFHIIGSGACGFLRINHILSRYIPLKYKGGGPKYQNSFQTWSENNGLIWDCESLQKEEKLRRVSLHDTITNITHSYLKYVPEFLEIYPNLKFLCLKGEKNHSIKSLATSWGYRNPCFVKDRQIGFGHNRYAVSQFPNYSNSKNHFESTKKYWEEYYQIADLMQKKYPNNFLLVDSPKFFSDIEYQLECFEFVGFDNNIFKPVQIPINFDDWTISTTLHGGIGNNLFQMGEVISFCKKYSLPKPVFGTWDLWDGGGKYPLSCNADRFLGGHVGSHEEIIKYFPNLNWKGDLVSTFDTKFVVNDMFRFCDIEDLNFVRDNFCISSKTKKNTVSLHFRFCTQLADDHVNGYVNDDFYVKVLSKIPENYVIHVFSDDNCIASKKIELLKSKFNHQFILSDDGPFETMKKISECEYHILHVSTFSFWAACLDINQPNNKVFYPKNFIDTHGENIIPYKEWICYE